MSNDVPQGGSNIGALASKCGEGSRYSPTLRQAVSLCASSSQVTPCHKGRKGDRTPAMKCQTLHAAMQGSSQVPVLTQDPILNSPIGDWGEEQ